MWEKVKYDKWEILIKSSEDDCDGPNHSHSDFIHFTVKYDEESVLIDSGRASYDPKCLHNEAYLPEFHNSVRIEGLGYKPDKKHLFPSNYSINNSTIDALSNNNSLIINIRTDGFNRIDKDICFIRKIRINGDSIIIEDISGSKNDLEIEHYFHFKKSQVDINSNKEINVMAGNKTILFVPETKQSQLSKNLLKKGINYYSTNYGVLENKHVYYGKNKINVNKSVIHELRVK